MRGAKAEVSNNIRVIVYLQDGVSLLLRPDFFSFYLSYLYFDNPSEVLNNKRSNLHKKVKACSMTQYDVIVQTAIVK